MRVMWIAVAFAALVAGFASGCARTVLVQEGSPIRVGPGIRGRIYHLEDGQWRLSDNAVELPEGWFILSPAFAEGDENGSP